MKLMKTTLRKLWRLTRTTSTVVGLAVMVALVAGVASLAVARTPSGGTTASAVLKGVQNTAATATTLINNVAGPALNLQVQPGNPPLTVNSGAGTATNLTAENAENADTVDGKDSSSFVSATNGKAPDSELLDGKDSTEFLGAGDTAVNSDKLDGKDSTDFAPAGIGTVFVDRNIPGTSLNPDLGYVVIVSEQVPAGSYVINAKVSLQNVDDDDWANADCELKAGGNVIDRGSLLTLGINTGAQEADAVGNTEEYPLQAVVAHYDGGTFSINCRTFSASDRVDANEAIITAIRVGSVE